MKLCIGVRHWIIFGSMCNIRMKSSYPKVKFILKSLQFAEAPSHVAATILILHCVKIDFAKFKRIDNTSY